MCLVNYYGMIAEAIGKDSETLELEISEQTDARTLFVSLYSQLAHLPFQVAIDTEIVERFDSRNFSSISLLPPFSGG